MRSFRFVIFVYLYQLGDAKDALPLFLIDYGRKLEHLTVDTNPFSMTDSIVFTDIIDYALKQCSVFIIFVEEQFCTEDISAKDSDGTPYVYLQSDLRHDKVKYFPNVFNPISLLSRALPPKSSNSFELRPGHPIQIPEGLPYYYIYFKDGQNESRVKTLRRHDLIMRGVFQETLNLSPPVSFIAVYTGVRNHVVLKKHSDDKPGGRRPGRPETKGVFLASQEALFHFVGLSIESVGHIRRDELKAVPKVVAEVRSFRKAHTEYLRTNIEYQGLQIKFSFRLLDKFWTLDNVTLIDGGEEMGVTTLGFKVPLYRSYYCNEPLIIINENDKSYLRISEYKIQPFRSRMTRRQDEGGEGGGDGGGEGAGGSAAEGGEGAAEGEGGFKPAVNCNQYFDIPILTGLFISAMCLSVLLASITFLLNCEANDHYDDPASAKQLAFSGD